MSSAEISAGIFAFVAVCVATIAACKRITKCKLACFNCQQDTNLPIQNAGIDLQSPPAVLAANVLSQLVAQTPKNVNQQPNVEIPKPPQAADSPV